MLQGRACVLHPYPNRYLIDSLHGAGLQVVLVCPRDVVPPGAPVEAVIDAPLHDDAAVMAAVEEFHRTRPLDLVVPLYEGCTHLSAAIAARLGLPGNPPEAADASRNKYLAYQCWARAGVSAPRTIPLLELDHAADAIEKELGFPAIVKLADSMNSQGVGLVRDRQEYAAYREVLRTMLSRPVDIDIQSDRNRLAYGRGAVKVLAQEFCRGSEVNVDILMGGGEYVVAGIFEKAPAMGPWFAETMSVSPTSLGPEKEAELGRLAIAAVKALGATVGAAHVEIRYSEQGPRVLEAGLRPGGGYTMQAIEHLTGYNMPVEVARMLSGGRAPGITPRRKAALYGGIVYPYSGTLRSVTGLEVFRDIPGLMTHVVLHKPGDRVYALPESAQPHLTYYLIGGETRDEVLALHRRIQESIRLEIEPFA
ncbi:ATP-grasp domain-containing protein [Myxococcus sp. RHSTA-1-4]|uniref:ATP-grasp domain-containing protein n=1 Tax=Myxococcus sp. RHSTA-1-4 TaxID=2874601 RepID=UPI001CC0875B|nr:ATP-grasp domain-containing protein [Myxococcus sp. RHSTA-1-4]MBZ4418399.1 ATP-grasp domain-containing protein [Myxococcus sp. RHSTA-1-4]